MAVSTAAIGAWAAANAGTIAAVSTAVSVASTAYGAYAQNQAAKAQASAMSEQAKQVAITTAESYDDLTPAEIDAQRNAADAALQQQAEALQAKGRVNVFAAASGTMGHSVDSMLFDIEAIEARNVNQILRQREAGLYSIKQNAEQLRQSAISQQSGMASQVASLQRPSWVETGAKIGTELISSADKYSQRYASTYSKQEPVKARSSV